MFDPLTNSFWYYNSTEMENGIPNTCWEHPKEFNDKLTCVWEPVEYPNNSTACTNQKCCVRFNTRRDYNTHRMKAHNWTCAACETINTGLTYPRCWVCNNSRGARGEVSSRLVFGKNGFFSPTTLHLTFPRQHPLRT
jgi:hypothetical protein